MDDAKLLDFLQPPGQEPVGYIVVDADVQNSVELPLPAGANLAANNQRYTEYAHVGTHYMLLSFPAGNAQASFASIGASASRGKTTGGMALVLNYQSA